MDLLFLRNKAGMDGFFFAGAWRISGEKFMKELIG
jgi:hypothetical protein